MKGWLFLILIIVILVMAGFTARYWMPPLFDFSETKSNTIEGLVGLMQLVLWLGASIILLIGFIKKRNKTKQSNIEKEVPKSNKTGKQSVSVDGDVTGSVIITGDKSKVIFKQKDK